MTKKGLLDIKYLQYRTSVYRRFFSKRVNKIYVNS